MFEIDLPVRFPRSTMVSVLYAVPLASVEEAIPHGLFPVSIGNRRAVLAVCWFEHHQSSLGDYRELGIGHWVSTSPLDLPTLGLGLLYRRSAVGAFMHQLYVTSAPARDAGRELASLPKSLAEIAFTPVGHALNATLLLSGRRALFMQIPLRWGLPIPLMELTMFSLHRGEVVRSSLRCGSLLTFSMPKIPAPEFHGDDPSNLPDLRKWFAEATPLSVVSGELLGGSMGLPTPIRSNLAGL